MTSKPHSFVAERWIARILRGGIVVSVLFMVTGLVLMTLRGASDFPSTNPPLGELISGILHASASSGLASNLMVVGLLLLMITPFLRVMATILVFLFEREWRYVAVALLVLLMLIGEVVFAFR